MKNSVKFISIYHVFCLLVAIFIKYLFDFYSTEIFSYLLWFYIEGLILGLVFYPLIRQFIDNLSIGQTAKVAIDGLICIVLINLVSLISDHRILTLDLIRDSKKGIDLHDNNLLIHFISLFCFVLTIFLLPGISRTRRDKRTIT